MKQHFLLDKRRRRSDVMQSDKYDLIFSFILKVLTLHGYIQFSELLDLALRDNTLTGYQNLGWSLILVKRDMEARNVIEVKVDSITLVQTIRLKKKIKLPAYFKFS